MCIIYVNFIWDACRKSDKFSTRSLFFSFKKWIPISNSSWAHNERRHDFQTLKHNNNIDIRRKIECTKSTLILTEYHCLDFHFFHLIRSTFILALRSLRFQILYTIHNSFTGLVCATKCNNILEKDSPFLIPIMSLDYGKSTARYSMNHPQKHLNSEHFAFWISLIILKQHKNHFRF